MASSNSINILIAAQDKASPAIKRVSNEIDKSAKRSREADAAFAGFANRLKVGLVAGAVAGAAALGAAVKSAADYQSSLSQLKQASGATAGEMEQLNAKARELGRDTSLAGVTASDAARTMVELSKAGLSVKDTLAAVRGTMSLAKAGNVEFADAAVISASALNAFSLKGSQATQVADTLAAGANASQANLSDLALGMQQSATVAKQFQLSLNENVTALALFANNGIKGSDAGTSLKTMLISLAHPSRQSADAMKKIGFNAYDASGKFVGLGEMSKRLHKSLKGLTKQQQQAALATIFGTDAFRAAAVLADNAGRSYDSMSKKVAKSGAAQQAARAQMGAFERATEGLSNSLSDLGLTVGSALLPILTSGASKASNFVNSLNEAVPTIRSLLPTIGSLTAGIVAFTVVQNAASVATKALAVAQGALNLVMRANPYALAIGAIVALGSALGVMSGQTDQNTSASKRLSAAQDELKRSTDAVHDAQHQLRDAELGEQGAKLAVERATRTLNEAIRQYGRGSLEAREAAFQLKEANARLADSQSNVKNKTNDVTKALRDQVKAKDAVVAAQNAIASAVAGAAAQYSNAASAANTFLRAEKQSKNPVVQNKSILGGSPFAKHAAGTPYAPGGLTLVGERGPELVSLPRGSQVTQAWKTRQTLSNAAEGGVTVNIHGNVINQTAEAATAWWDRLDATARRARRGMAGSAAA